MLSAAFSALLILFALFDWFDQPPREFELKPFVGVLIAKPQAVKPNKAPVWLQMHVRSESTELTGVVQNFEFLPTNSNASILLNLNPGVKITVYRRTKESALGGPCDVWAIDLEGSPLVSLSDVAAAARAGNIRRYKTFALLLGASMLVFVIGRHRERLGHDAV